MFSLLALPASLLLLSAQVFAAPDCSASGIKIPTVYGANITSLTAEVISDLASIPGNNVCGVTITLTHPGTGDLVTTLVTLPLTGWNGRFQGIGGGGWAAGNPPALGPVNAMGYSAATTDAGVPDTLPGTEDASPWALISPGNVNQYNLLNFARRSLHDMTVIGKAVSESFYGSKVQKSYWNGCSTGGRQGLMFAQYYPEDYDGILADAPAIQWTDVATAGAWLWTVLVNEGYFPNACEFQAVTDAVTAACDELDGLRDGAISAPGLCHFDPHTLVGKSFTCSLDGSNGTFSTPLANVVSKIWGGARTPNNEFLWYGLPRGANFSALFTARSSLTTTTPVPFPISDTWIQGFIKKDLTFNTSSITYDTYPDIFLAAHLEYDSIIGTASPDLRAFKKRGGKIITWQGLADQLVPPQGTILYYHKVAALDPSVSDFYRLFFSPGVGHCEGGIGVLPLDPIGQLRRWVENGTAPATLRAGSYYPVNASPAMRVNGTVARNLNLCHYPKVNKYNGHGDPNVASSYTCQHESGWESFGGPSGRNYSCYGGPGWYGGKY